VKIDNSLSIVHVGFGFFGFKALWFIFAAMFIAIVTGFIYMGLEKGDKDMERLVRVFSKTRVLAEKDERYCDGQLENWYFDVRNKYLNGSKE